jgi:hypothetical protein
VSPRKKKEDQDDNKNSQANTATWSESLVVGIEKMLRAFSGDSPLHAGQHKNDLRERVILLCCSTVLSEIAENLAHSAVLRYKRKGKLLEIWQSALLVKASSIDPSEFRTLPTREDGIMFGNLITVEVVYRRDNYTSREEQFGGVKYFLMRVLQGNVWNCVEDAILADGQSFVDDRDGCTVWHSPRIAHISICFSDDGEVFSKLRYADRADLFNQPYLGG